MMVTALGAAVSDTLDDGTRRERRRRPVQLRRDGARAAGRALDPVRARDARVARRGVVEHSVELRPRDDSAPPARHRRHRVRHRRSARPNGSRGRRGAAGDHGRALPGALRRATRSTPASCRATIASRTLRATIIRSTWSNALCRGAARGLFEDLPFGSDITPEEVVLAKALRGLQSATHSWPGKISTMLRALFADASAPSCGPIWHAWG